jgi:hypothetical protein
MQQSFRLYITTTLVHLRHQLLVSHFRRMGLPKPTVHLLTLPHFYIPDFWLPVHDIALFFVAHAEDLTDLSMATTIPAVHLDDSSSSSSLNAGVTLSSSVSIGSVGAFVLFPSPSYA